MNRANRNTIWASIVAEELYRSQVRTICVSPGSRSTPLVMAFAEYRAQANSNKNDKAEKFEVLVHIDERSAGFFALGLAKVTKQPVALLCTSGTAVANYYPAIIEAFYSHIPLVVLTADRPPELRDCGAGQTIDQIKLFGDHVRYFFEVGTPEISEFKLRYLRSLISHAVAIATGQGSTPAGAVHLNLAFADPLTPVEIPQDLPASIPANSLVWPGRKESYIQAFSGERSLSTKAVAILTDQIQSSPRGLIVVGVYDAPSGFAQAVKKLAQVTGYPLLVESTGIDRFEVIGGYDSFLRSPNFCQTHVPQLVIRFGAMPTSKSYQLWLESHLNSGLQQIIVNDGSNTDPTHGFTQIINTNPISFCEQLGSQGFNPSLPKEREEWQQDFMRAEEITQSAIANFMSSTEILFDGKVYTELAKWLPKNTHLYVAGSTPIRDLDSFFHNYQNIPVLANRGANGIDGTLSSALGAAWGCPEPMILICGDLAFYHDLNGLMAVKKYNINLTVILLNNDGGGIFEMLPIAKFEPPFEEFFGTPHGLDFAPIVKAYGCDYIEIKDWQHFQDAVLDSLQSDGTQVLEIKSDRQLNKQLHQDFWQTVVRSHYGFP